jgi:quercetin dioxygenase-like cupin family protein
MLLTNKEVAMKRLLLSGLVAMFCITNSFAQEAGKVERKGTAGKVKHEEVVSGYLSNLNGKYKLRVSENTFEPGGYVGDHHHAGPGIRVVTAGELTLVQAGKTTIKKAGDTFYESGDVSIAVHNKGKVPAVILNFEILPVDLKGSSNIPAKSKK